MKYRGAKSPFGKDKIYNSLGISLNSINYFGDLSPSSTQFSTDLSLTRPSCGISFSRRKGPRFTVQSGFMYGAIQGSDVKSADRDDRNSGIYRYQRNLSFRNRIKEFSFVLIFDLIKNHSTFLHRAPVTPYVFTGIALFHHNPQAKVPTTDLQGNPFVNAGEWVDLQPLGTEGQYAPLKNSDVNFGLKPYKRIQPSVPFGLGVRCQLTSWLDLAIEFSYHKTWTDYLDDVSENYVDLGVFGNNELAKALSYRSNEICVPSYTYTSERDGTAYAVLSGYGSEQESNMRGNKHNNDEYLVTSIRVSHILGKSHYKPKSR